MANRNTLYNRRQWAKQARALLRAGQFGHYCDAYAHVRSESNTTAAPSKPRGKR